MASPRLSLLQRMVFAALVLSGVCSKLFRIYLYRSLPLYNLAIYFPTFFILEVPFFATVWAILSTSTGRYAIVAVTGAGLLACIDLIATASQFSFYYVTGGEIRWEAAKSVGSSREGLKLILSGLIPTLTIAIVISVASWLAAPWIWHFMTQWMNALSDGMTRRKTLGRPLSKVTPMDVVFNKARLWTALCVLLTVGLWAIRPAVPYNHISETLPFVLLGHLNSNSMPAEISANPFPFPELLGSQFWEAPQGHYKGWCPTLGSSNHDRSLKTKSYWAQTDLPPGFERWTVNSESNANTLPEENRGSSRTDNKKKGQRAYYDPTQDPLRISNFDLDLVESLEAAVKERDIPIAHIVMIFLESGRKDLFPFKSDSRLYNQIHETYDFTVEGAEADFNSKLASLTPVAERITGESSGFFAPLSNKHDSRVAGPDLGGINIDGLTTGSSLSGKSRLVNYCGLQALPVDFMAENDLVPYQPCLMQIMQLFNQRKIALNDSHDDSFLGRQWHTVYAQSVTGEFQRQTQQIHQIGFNQTLYAEDINKFGAKYWHERMEKINYFGYAETEARSYIRDMINETLSEGKRLFLSHFTSTTHHPWATPSGFERRQFFASHNHLSPHKQMNDYLNAISFVDQWLGDLMNLVEEAGIANETLTIFVGDHGQAFAEDSPLTGTYLNPHISNFRVPLVFHHPLLPRIHITANTTTVSILPTILDLLVSTRSLNEVDTQIALDLMNEYEGQSLIRPFQVSRNGRESWNMGIINAGASVLSVASAAVPYRLGLPLSKDFEYRFANLEIDPYETSPLTDWTMENLASKVLAHHGPDAAKWLDKAEKIGLWWVEERKRLWNYEESDM